jgi:hypothetical protein
MWSMRQHGHPMLDPFFPGPSWKLPRGTYVAHHSLVHFETNCKLCFDVGPSVGFWSVTYGTVSTVERKPLLLRGEDRVREGLHLKLWLSYLLMRYGRGMMAAGAEA